MMRVPLKAVCRSLPILALVLAPTAPAATPPADVPVRHLAVRELWRIPAEDEAWLVSTVTDAAFDPRGDLCIADVRQKCVFVFGRDGSFRRTLGRAGEGPGESRDVRNVFFAGDRYGLLQAVPGAIVWLHGDGTPAGKVAIAPAATEGESFVNVAWARQDGTRILAWIDRSSVRDGQLVRGEQGIVEVAPDGSVGPLIYSEPEMENPRTDDGIDEGKVHDIWMRRWCGDGQGGAWVAPERDRYLLQHWGPGGRLLHEVELPYTLVVRSAKGRDRMLAWMTGRGWKKEQVRIGRTAPVFADLRLGAEGRLWARLDLGGKVPDGDVSRAYDVFDRDGRRLEHVRVHGGADANVRVVVDDRTMVSLTDDPGTDEQWLAQEVLEEMAAAE
jgi:hypothetical protein